MTTPNHDSTETPAPADQPHPPATSAEVPAGEPGWLVAAGDDVLVAGESRLRATVLAVYTPDGVPECWVRFADGSRGAVRPWHVLPADGGSPHWRQAMRAVHEAVRVSARARLAREQLAVAGEAEALAGQLTAFAAAVRDGRGYLDPDLEFVANPANNLDGSIATLRELHNDFADLLPDGD